MEKKVKITKICTIDTDGNNCGKCSHKTKKKTIKREYVGVWYDDVEYEIPFCKAFEQELYWNEKTKTSKLKRCCECLKSTKELPIKKKQLKKVK